MRNFVFNTIVVLSACCLTSILAASGSDWNYKRDDLTKGPGQWGTLYPECAKNRNSPIDIVKGDAIRKTQEAWKLAGWDDTHTWSVHNSPFTAKFSLESGTITTNGGSLGTQYDVIQFHLHWGATNSKGSEHTVDGSYYPMEVHFVHKNNMFTTIGKAVESEQEDALAVLGFFFKIQSADNPLLTPMINAIKSVRESGNESMSNIALADLSKVMGATTDGTYPGNYYRYMGGLTTPGCNQIVKWTVFQNPVGISASQMDIVRNVTEMTYGTELYRDVQKIGSRTVTLYDSDCTDVTCGASAILAPLSLLLFSFVSKYL